MSSRRDGAAESGLAASDRGLERDRESPPGVLPFGNVDVAPGHQRRGGLTANLNSRPRCEELAVKELRQPGLRGTGGGSAGGPLFALTGETGGPVLRGPLSRLAFSFPAPTMAARKNTHGLRLTHVRGITVVDIGRMEIWDGVDLSLIRDTLTVLIARRRRRAVGIQMKHVKYVPGGFFGMLYDWFETGVRIYLLRPQERITNMLWFQRFFLEERPGLWRLEDLYETGIDGEHPATESTVVAPGEWAGSGRGDADHHLVVGSAG